MFGKKKDLRQIKNEILGDVADNIVEQVKDKILAEAVAMSERSMTEVLNATDSIERIKQEKLQVEEELTKLKSKKKIEETEIKTLIKVTQEKAELDMQRRELELDKQYVQKELEAVKKYHEELGAAVSKERDKMERFMSEVMARLTNIDNKEGQEIKVIK